MKVIIILVILIIINGQMLRPIENSLNTKIEGNKYGLLDFEDQAIQMTIEMNTTLESNMYIILTSDKERFINGFDVPKIWSLINTTHSDSQNFQVEIGHVIEQRTAGIV
jgi:hypothetical protein